MADAPSSGGSHWGPFEILLVVLLSIGLLSALTNKGKGTPVFDLGEGKDTTTTREDTSTNSCGLAIVTPLSLARISTEIHLSGYVHGCNWTPKDGIALYAQVINASGMPVSDYVAVPDAQTDILYTAFDTTIQITQETTGSGYLILIPATPTTKSISVRIPLQFVRK
jgi:hypothetical protein